MGFAITLLLDTCVFIVISFIISLVLIDQVAPVFNLFTAKSVDLQSQLDWINLISIFFFLAMLVLVVGILPSWWYARSKAVDILRKIRD